MKMFLVDNLDLIIEQGNFLEVSYRMLIILPIPSQLFYYQNITDSMRGNLFDDENESFNFEPNFLFSKDILEKAIPGLLSQTATSGRQFAHILIRSYQEKNYNQFNYIEKEAEFIGKKRFPLSVDDIFDLCKKNNLSIKWFEKSTFNTKDDSGKDVKSLFRSFYNKDDNTIYINSKMINDLSVDDRHTNIQDLLSKQAKVFEGLKDDPEAMIKEISNFKPFKKLKKKKKKKKNKKNKEK